jgi:hypothetical protein
VRHYVGRFGHGAKVWLVIWGLFSLFLVWMARTDWQSAVEVFVIFSLLIAVNLWFQVSQRVWYDDELIGTKISGAPRVDLHYSAIASVERSHSWKRVAKAPGSAPLDELVISGRDGREVRISLRHQKIADLIAMLAVIHDKTGLPVPSLADLK